MLIVGPTSGLNGYPVWYKDENGLRLQLNVDPNDPYSGLSPEDLPNPSEPVSFPDNFPAESFYFTAEAEMTTGTGERARLVLALEAAFVNEIPTEGEQIVFGRVRIRVSGLLPNVEYTVSHPYGVNIFVAEPDAGNPAVGEINFTEDIGDHNFEVAASSRIYPFIRWDESIAPAAPVGYIGDPNTLHPIIGSLFIDPQGQPQNYFRIEGLGIGIGSPDRATTPGIDPDNNIETRNFSVLGKISLISGVDITRTTYSRVDAAGGLLDGFASSDVIPQNILLSGPGFDPTPMQGSQGHYLAHVFFEGEPPDEVVVTNISDQPDSVKTATPVDLVSGLAIYNTDTDELTVSAQSSDEFGNPQLIVVGYGTIPGSGTLTVTNLNSVPAFITVTSVAGGEIVLPVLIEGSPFNPIGVQANAGEDQTVLIGTQVSLDGTNSSGPIASFQWTQIAGPSVVLLGEATVTATFTAPNIAASLEFELAVTGPGGPSTDSVTIVVVESAPVPIADAGPDQTVVQGTVVTLSGSSSISQVSFLWEQIIGIPVQLNGDDTPNPTFVFPKQTQPLVFRLTVTGPGGSSSDTVMISTLPDNLTVTRAEFRIQDSEWRIEGTSDVFGPGVAITIYLGNNIGGLILTQVNVDALGDWRYREEDVTIQPDGTRAITIQSSSGGLIASIPLTIRQ